MTCVDFFLRHFAGDKISQYLDLNSLVIDVERGGYITINNINIPLNLTHPSCPLSFKNFSIGCVRICPNWKPLLVFNRSDKLKIEINDLVLDLCMIEFDLWPSDDLLEFILTRKIQLINELKHVFKTFTGLNVLEKIGLNAANSLSVTAINTTINLHIELKGFSNRILKLVIPETKVSDIKDLNPIDDYGINYSLMLGIDINIHGATLTLEGENTIKMTNSPFSATIRVKKWSLRSLAIKSIFHNFDTSTCPLVSVSLNFNNLDLYFNEQVLDFIYSISPYFCIWTKWYSNLRNKYWNRPTHEQALSYVEGKLSPTEREHFEKTAHLSTLFRLNGFKWFKYRLKFDMNSNCMTISTGSVKISLILKVFYNVYEINSKKLFLTFENIFIRAVDEKQGEFPILFHSIDAHDERKFELLLKQFTDHITTIDIKIPKLTLALGNIFGIISIFPDSISCFDRVREVIEDFTNRELLTKYKNRTLVKVQIAGFEIIALALPDPVKDKPLDQLDALRAYNYQHHIVPLDILSTDSSDNDSAFGLVDCDQFLESHQVTLPVEGQFKYSNEKFITNFENAKNVTGIYSHVYTSQLFTLSGATEIKHISIYIKDLIVFADKMIDHVSLNLSKLSFQFSDECFLLKKLKLIIYKNVTSLLIGKIKCLLFPLLFNFGLTNYSLHQKFILDWVKLFASKLIKVVQLFMFKQDWYSLNDDNFQAPEKVVQAITIKDSDISYPEFDNVNPSILHSSKLKILQLALSILSSTNELNAMIDFINFDFLYKLNNISACFRFASIEVFNNKNKFIYKNEAFSSIDPLIFEFNFIKETTVDYYLESAIHLSHFIVDHKQCTSLSLSGFPELPKSENNSNKIKEILSKTRVKLTSTFDSLQFLIGSDGQGKKLYIGSSGTSKLSYDSFETELPEYITSNDPFKRLIITMSTVYIMIFVKEDIEEDVIAKFNFDEILFDLSFVTCKLKQFAKPQQYTIKPMRSLRSVVFNKNSTQSTEIGKEDADKKNKYSSMFKKLKIAMRFKNLSKSQDSEPTTSLKDIDHPKFKTDDTQDSENLSTIHSHDLLFYLGSVSAIGFKSWVRPKGGSSSGLRGEDEDLILLAATSSEESKSNLLLAVNASGIYRENNIFSSIYITLKPIQIYLDSNPMLTFPGLLDTGHTKNTKKDFRLLNKYNISIWSRLTIEGIEIYLPSPRAIKAARSDKLGLYRLILRTSIYTLATNLISDKIPFARMWNSRHSVTSDWSKFGLTTHSFSVIRKLYSDCNLKSDTSRGTRRGSFFISLEEFFLNLLPTAQFNSLQKYLMNLELTIDDFGANVHLDSDGLEVEGRVLEIQLAKIDNAANSNLACFNIIDSWHNSGIKLLYTNKNHQPNLVISLVNINVQLDVKLIKNLINLMPPLESPKVKKRNCRTIFTLQNVDLWILHDFKPITFRDRAVRPLVLLNATQSSTLNFHKSLYISGFGVCTSLELDLSSSLSIQGQYLSLRWGNPSNFGSIIKLLDLLNFNANMNLSLLNSDCLFIQKLLLIVKSNSLTIDFPLVLYRPFIDFYKFFIKLFSKRTHKFSNNSKIPITPDSSISLSLTIDSILLSLNPTISNSENNFIARATLEQTQFLTEFMNEQGLVNLNTFLSIDGWNEFKNLFPILEKSLLKLSFQFAFLNLGLDKKSIKMSSELGSITFVISEYLFQLLDDLYNVPFQRVDSSKCLVYNELENTIGLDVGSEYESILIPQNSYREINIPFTILYNCRIFFIDKFLKDKTFDNRCSKILLYGNTNDVFKALGGHGLTLFQNSRLQLLSSLVCPSINNSGVPSIIIGSLLRFENRTRLTLTISTPINTISKKIAWYAIGKFNAIQSSYISRNRSSIHKFGSDVSDTKNDKNSDLLEYIVLSKNQSCSVPLSWIQSEARISVSIDDVGDSLRTFELNDILNNKYHESWNIKFSKTCGIIAKFNPPSFSNSMWGFSPRTISFEPLLRIHNNLVWPAMVYLPGTENNLHATVPPGRSTGFCCCSLKITLNLKIVFNNKIFENKSICLPRGTTSGSKITKILHGADNQPLPIVFLVFKHTIYLSLPVQVVNLTNYSLYVGPRLVRPENFVVISANEASSVRINNESIEEHGSNEQSVHKVNLFAIQKPIYLYLSSGNQISLGWSIWTTKISTNPKQVITLHHLYGFENMCDESIFVSHGNTNYILPPGNLVEVPFSEFKIKLLDLEENQFCFDATDHEKSIQGLLGNKLIDISFKSGRHNINLTSYHTKNSKLFLEKTNTFLINIKLSDEPRLLIENNSSNVIITRDALATTKEFKILPNEKVILRDIEESISLKINGDTLDIPIKIGTYKLPYIYYKIEVSKKGGKKIIFFDSLQKDLISTEVEAEGPSFSLLVERLTISLTEKRVLAALHLVGLDLSLMLGDNLKLKTSLNSLHIDHFIPGGGIPSILQTCDFDMDKSQVVTNGPFFLLDLNVEKNNESAPQISASSTISPIYINIEFTVFKRILAFLRKIKLPQSTWLVTSNTSGSFYYFKKVQTPALVSFVCIRTGGQESFQDELMILKIIEWLPLDTPKIKIVLGGGEIEDVVGTIDQLGKRIKSSYLRQLFLHSIPNVWLSYPLAFLLGITKGIESLVKSPVRLFKTAICKETSRLESSILGSRIGIMLCFLHIIGGAFQSIGHALNMVHKICGGQKVTPVGIADSLWLAINGLLADIFYYPWVSLGEEYGTDPFMYFVRFTIKIIRCAACPLLGVVNFLTTISEGFSNTLVGDFEHFAHLKDL